MWSLATFADDVAIPLTTTQQESAANSGIGRDERSLSFAPEASRNCWAVLIVVFVDVLTNTMVVLPLW